MKYLRLGNYQRVVLKGIEREGSQPHSIKRGYPQQVKSLLKRRLVKLSKSRLYLTRIGKKRLRI